MKSGLHIILLQYDIEWHDIKVNLAKINELLDSVNSSVDLILLPEMFASGFTMQPELFSEEDNKTVHNWMNEIAKKYNSAIIGSKPDKVNNEFYNRLHFVTSDGVHQVYDKRHLFAMGDEPKHYVAGKEKKIVEYKNWKILPLICYDLRFPVWSRNVSQGYDLLIFIANWPAVRNNAWEALLKARAIENQCYTIGVNRVGKDGRGIEYIGNSQVISPRGEVLHKIENKEGIIITELDLELQRRYRNSFPVLEDADDFVIDS